MGKVIVEPRSGHDAYNYKGGVENVGSIAFFNSRISRNNTESSKRGYAGMDNVDGEYLCELYARHSKCCEICGIEFSELSRCFSVDHCHKTGLFRGFLCGKCNCGLGNLKDDPEVLRRAILYLENR